MSISASLGLSSRSPSVRTASQLKEGPNSGSGAAVSPPNAVSQTFRNSKLHNAPPMSSGAASSAASSQTFRNKLQSVPSVMQGTNPPPSVAAHSFNSGAFVSDRDGQRKSPPAVASAAVTPLSPVSDSGEADEEEEFGRRVVHSTRHELHDGKAETAAGSGGSGSGSGSGGVGGNGGPSVTASSNQSSASKRFAVPDGHWGCSDCGSIHSSEMKTCPIVKVRSFKSPKVPHK